MAGSCDPCFRNLTRWFTEAFADRASPVAVNGLVLAGARNCKLNIANLKLPFVICDLASAIRRVPAPFQAQSASDTLS
jgi:hypothetical protein